MRILFAGTPDVAADTLREINEEFEIAAILTRPDAEQGRGRSMKESSVKKAGEELNIPVWTDDPSSPEFVDKLKENNIDIGIIVAYGRILKSNVLGALPCGWYNLHFSLLPQWRGAAPVQRAIWAGDPMTGITIFKLCPGLDDGPIATQEKFPIENHETSGSLMEELGKLGSRAFIDVLKSIENNTITLVEQDDSNVPEDHRLAKKITVEEAHFDPSLTAHIADCHIRAATPSPSAWCFIGSSDDEVKVQETPGKNEDDSSQWGVRVRIDKACEVLPDDSAFNNYYINNSSAIDKLKPGSIIQTKKHVWVKCANDSNGKPTYIELLVVTPANKKSMETTTWLRGARLGDRLECR